VRAGDLEAVLRSKIGRIFTNFSLNATLGRLRSIQVYVVLARRVNRALTPYPAFPP